MRWTAALNSGDSEAFAFSDSLCLCALISVCLCGECLLACIAAGWATSQRAARRLCHSPREVLFDRARVREVARWPRSIRSHAPMRRSDASCRRCEPSRWLAHRRIGTGRATSSCDTLQGRAIASFRSIPELPEGKSSLARRSTPACATSPCRSTWSMCSVPPIGLARSSMMQSPSAREVVWMQLGVRNDGAAARAEAAGIEVIMNRCPKIEFGRLRWRTVMEWGEFRHHPTIVHLKPRRNARRSPGRSRRPMSVTVSRRAR